MLGKFGDGFQPTSIAVFPFVQLLPDTLQPLFRLGGGAENEIQRQETGAIGLFQCHQFETFQLDAAVMIKYPGQQIDNFRAGSIIGIVIKDQDFIPRLAGKSSEKVDSLVDQGQQENFRQLWRGYYC